MRHVLQVVATEERERAAGDGSACGALARRDGSHKLGAVGEGEARRLVIDAVERERHVHIEIGHETATRHRPADDLFVV